jgi:hypothetical protein
MGSGWATGRRAAARGFDRQLWCVQQSGKAVAIGALAMRVAGRQRVEGSL